MDDDDLPHYNERTRRGRLRWKPWPDLVALLGASVIAGVFGYLFMWGLSGW